MLFNKELDDDNIFYKDNWNEYGGLLKGQFHCYTLHYLYDHTILSWSDILKIDMVWIEIVVRHQFFSELKK